MDPSGCSAPRRYAALHGAGRRLPDLLGSATSVYVGVWASEYAEVLRQSAAAQSVFVGTAYACSVMAGRLSFVLGLQGPCASFDTACSSSLVACHSGILDLHHQESDQALVAGVNMLFNPHANAMNAIAGMTSARGRSHSFDARADGYVRCEACCAVALEHAAPEQSASSNVLGCAVRQDGRSASLTAPNGVAQQRLLKAAHANAGAAPRELQAVEAHGTGTALGDPIEAGAVAAAMLSERAPHAPLTVGSIKANMGHGEPGAGLAGLLKLLAVLQNAQGAPNAQLRVLNPHVGTTLQSKACALLTQLASLRSSAGSSSLGGVSSFGYCGTIAHAVGRAIVKTHTLRHTLTPVYKRRRYNWVPLTQHRRQAGAGAEQALALYTTVWQLPQQSAHPEPSESQSLQVVAAPGGARSEMLRAVTSSCTRACGRAHADVSGGEARGVGFRTTWRCAARWTAPSLDGAAAALALAQHVASVGAAPALLLLLTCGSQAVAARGAPARVSAAAHGGAWGLARVLRLEQPSVRVLSVDAFEGDEASAARGAVMEVGARGVRRSSRGAAACVWWRGCSDARHRARGGGRGRGVVGGRADVRAERWAWWEARAAALLAARGAGGLVLASRGGRVARDGQGLAAALRALRGAAASGTAVLVAACDVGVAAEAAALMRAAHAAAAPRRLGGVLHAAGVLRDRLLRSATAAELAAVHAPKAYGAWHVHGATACAALEWAVHFSSVAACFGNVGQASYATANAYLDSLALGRRAHGAAACSLQLPLVAGAGMGAATLDERQMREMAAVSLEEYAACLDAALGAAGAEARVVRAVLPWSPERVSRSVPDASQPVFAEVARASASGGEGASTAGVAAASEWAREVSRVSASRRGAHVEAQVVAVVRELSGEAGVGAGTPLMEAGVDSLAATELAGRLRELTGLAALADTGIRAADAARDRGARTRAAGCDGGGGGGWCRGWCAGRRRDRRFVVGVGGRRSGAVARVRRRAARRVVVACVLGRRRGGSGAVGAVVARARGRRVVAERGDGGVRGSWRVRPRRGAVRRRLLRRVAGGGGGDGAAAAAAARAGVRGAARRGGAARDGARQRRRRVRGPRAAGLGATAGAVGGVGSVVGVRGDGRQRVDCGRPAVVCARAAGPMRDGGHGVLVGARRAARRLACAARRRVRLGARGGSEPQAAAARDAGCGVGGYALGGRAVQDVRRARERVRAVGGRGRFCCGRGRRRGGAHRWTARSWVAARCARTGGARV